MAKDNDTLVALMSRVALGDRRAFRSVYDATASDICGLLHGMLGQADAVDDALQETYVKVWHRAGDYHPDRGQVNTWIASIARYRAIDVLRAKKRRSGTDDELATLPDLRSDVLELVSGDADVDRLASCLETLSGDQQQSISLAFYRGYTHEEVASVFGTPLGTVKAWIRRGLKKLRECLEG